MNLIKVSKIRKQKNIILILKQVKNDLPVSLVLMIKKIIKLNIKKLTRHFSVNDKY